MSEALAELPTIQTKPGFDPKLPFTDPEFAKAQSAKAHQAKNEAMVRLKWLETLHFSQTPVKPPTGQEQGPESNLSETGSQTVKEQLQTVKDQIARTLAELNSDEGFCKECERYAMPAHHRAQLLRALDTLFDRQCKLLGIAYPGPTKARSRTGRESRPPVEPVG